MNGKKPSHRRLLASCAEIGPDDGIDPRELARGGPPRRVKRKALQLSRQVAEALNLAFAGCRDEVLSGLVVTAVEPANSGRLLVTVAASPAAVPVGAGTVLAHLHRAAGLLRSEVAASVHRRFTPELAFRVAVRDGE
jgi:ribosome-binding factor A